MGVRAHERRYWQVVLVRNGPEANVAIDGPAGAGKSTLARALADRIGFTHLDTGAFYRVLGWLCMRDGLPVEDLPRSHVTQLATQVELRFTSSEVFLGSKEMSREIRTPHVSALASRVATIREVREILAAKQRAYGAEGGVVADGRDVGRVLFPAARLKIYLTADPRKRALRRIREREETEANLETVTTEIITRDEQDMSREVDPLLPAEDAITVDSSSFSIPQVVDYVESLARERLRLHR